MINDKLLAVNDKSGQDLKLYLQSLITSNTAELEDIATWLIRAGGRVSKREATFFTFEDKAGFRFRVYRAPPTSSIEDSQPAKSYSAHPKKEEYLVNQMQSLVYILFIINQNGEDITAYLGNTVGLNKRLISHERDDKLPGAKNAGEIFALAAANGLEIYIAALDLCFDKRLMASLRPSWHQHLLALGVTVPSVKRMPKAAYVYEGLELTSASDAALRLKAGVEARLSLSEAINSNISIQDLMARTLSYLP